MNTKIVDATTEAVLSCISLGESMGYGIQPGDTLCIPMVPELWLFELIVIRKTFTTVNDHEWRRYLPNLTLHVHVKRRSE